MTDADDKEPMARVPLVMPESLKKELRDQAEHEDLTMSQAIRKAIREWLPRARKRKDEA